MTTATTWNATTSVNERLTSIAYGVESGSSLSSAFPRPSSQPSPSKSWCVNNSLCWLFALQCLQCRFAFSFQSELRHQRKHTLRKSTQCLSLSSGLLHSLVRGSVNNLNIRFGGWLVFAINWATEHEEQSDSPHCAQWRVLFKHAERNVLRIILLHRIKFANGRRRHNLANLRGSENYQLIFRIIGRGDDVDAKCN